MWKSFLIAILRRILAPGVKVPVGDINVDVSVSSSSESRKT